MTPDSGKMAAAAPLSGPGDTPDARDLATPAALRSLLFGLAPIVITLAAVTLGSMLPVPWGALVSFALVAVCVFLAVFNGVRGLRLIRPLREARILEQKRFARAGAAGAAARGTDRAMTMLHGMSVTGLVLGCVHGVFLLGSLALNLPLMFWLASVHR